MNKEFDRCTRCVLTKSIPNIKFDEQGVCNFCRDELFVTFDREKIVKAQEEVTSILSQVKGRHEYDAILCYSGGKDSTYTLKLAVEQYGLRILAFTLDNGFISPTAFKNINRVVDYLGVDHITVRPSVRNLKSIFRVSALHRIYNPRSLVRISSVCNSCISIVNNTAVRFAMERKIPLIIAGFTLGQVPANSITYVNNYRFLQESRKEAMDRLREYCGAFVDRYFCIPDWIIDQTTELPRTINLLCLEDISEKDMVIELRKVGWENPGDVDGCSSNCRLNTFNNTVHEQVCGYNPYELELSHLIRSNQLDREEAIRKLTSKPEGVLQAIMTELEISEEDLRKLEKVQSKKNPA